MAAPEAAKSPIKFLAASETAVNIEKLEWRRAEVHKFPTAVVA